MNIHNRVTTLYNEISYYTGLLDTRYEYRDMAFTIAHARRKSSDIPVAVNFLMVREKMHTYVWDSRCHLFNDIADSSAFHTNYYPMRSADYLADNISIFKLLHNVLSPK